MGSRAIQFLGQFPISIPIPQICYRRFLTGIYTSNTRRKRCYSGGRSSGGSRWDWNENANANKRSRFSDAYAADEYDDDEFAFRNEAKQRKWWSDNSFREDDEEDDQGFGIYEAAIGFNWVLKVFRAFGWMIPAVMISLLLGTGPNAIVMTLALPLAQSAFYLVTDTLWGRSDETPRPKSKSKKRPFAGAKSRTRVRKEKDVRSQAETEAQNYKSWVDANNGSSEKDKSNNPQDFGGWDELDNQARPKNEPRVTPSEPANEPRSQDRVKLSRRTKGETPLLMRLLIAMFPYLGFWTKLF
ncbi:hypothetical protein ABFS82_06G197500 [Erythranthe guttata]|uniref:Uncharacterized protein n=1 Tax=Erythranthe guttata TaxID=4155 RepID=A0A022RKX1_ERYGU|nr:PREDICTED: uncharacterized protein LOC105955489 [Erythranthe guttata]XP_012834673.1 PREDICTED: uncharacterized protein LOC105955489 [Erythranthe guttata]EYU39525.1 hypothetical protein MIMGU_mgv1a010887mg [Erythranthe guttata]|eukprot:XP_012834672.1 PREDICTED: uncharacterized protein LOC105955489 [Erythranthe guttata]